MTLLAEGLNRIRDMIYDDIDKGQLGTDGTVSSESDTGLISADATTLLALSSLSKSDKTITFNYTLPSTGGSTTTYREFELQKSATPVNYDRIVFTGISFTTNGSQDLIISKKYFVKAIV